MRRNMMRNGSLIALKFPTDRTPPAATPFPPFPFFFPPRTLAGLMTNASSPLSGGGGAPYSCSSSRTSLAMPWCRGGPPVTRDMSAADEDEDDDDVAAEAEARLCTRPTRPSDRRTLMPRGWLPLVSTSRTAPETVRPVGWSSLRTMLTAAPGTTWVMLGTRDAPRCAMILWEPLKTVGLGYSNHVKRLRLAPVLLQRPRADRRRPQAVATVVEVQHRHVQLVELVRVFGAVQVLGHVPPRVKGKRLIALRVVAAVSVAVAARHGGPQHQAVAPAAHRQPPRVLVVAVLLRVVVGRVQRVHGRVPVPEPPRLLAVAVRLVRPAPEPGHVVKGPGQPREQPDARDRVHLHGRVVAERTAGPHRQRRRRLSRVDRVDDVGVDAPHKHLGRHADAVVHRRDAVVAPPPAHVAHLGVQLVHARRVPGYARVAPAGLVVLRRPAHEVELRPALQDRRAVVHRPCDVAAQQVEAKGRRTRNYLQVRAVACRFGLAEAHDVLRPGLVGAVAAAAAAATAAAATAFAELEREEGFPGFQLVVVKRRANCYAVPRCHGGYFKDHRLRLFAVLNCVPAGLKMAEVDEPIVVGYDDLARGEAIAGPSRNHWLDHLFVLKDGRHGRVVRQHQSIHDKVCVVGEVAKVSAEPMVGPLPDQAALGADVGSEGGNVVDQRAGAVAHCARGSDDCQDALVVLLVVNEPRRVGRPDPLCHGEHVLAHEALVAQAPEDDGHVVPQSPHQLLGAVHVRVSPLGVVGGVRLGRHVAALVAEAVALEVRLGNDVKPQLVGQVEKVRVRRLVRRPDRVDVVPLHDEQVVAQRRVRHRPAVQVVVLVPVHAVDLDRSAVDQKGRPVGAALHAPEPEALADGAPVEGYQGRVQAGRLGRPDVQVVTRHGEDGTADLRRGTVPFSDFRAAVWAQKLDVERPVVALYLDRGAESAGGEGRVELWMHLKIHNGRRRGKRHQIHVPEDARQPPLVLILNVRAVRPLVDPGRHVVGLPAAVEVGRDVELARVAAAQAAVADRSAVDLYVERAVDALEAQPDLLAVPPVRHLKLAKVGARRVDVRDVGRRDGERELDVGVVRMAVALELPHARHLDVGP
ncbi:hypothetical protein PpBr36_00627 [Pyricularia pennisetigena]|uniref:hypothetical protein n=1 Tax=Pyricularia pennisetigena TaxID=1578925 RepID=UPI0011508142|nr:hypothetical protein PpBr36_00627 [Pyricularia pennisetigena]TLS29735.1 hypothetical protein PpBr36_00627 [Pyricularia pennisetigena]